MIVIFLQLRQGQKLREFEQLDAKPEAEVEGGHAAAVDEREERQHRKGRSEAAAGAAKTIPRGEGRNGEGSVTRFHAD